MRLLPTACAALCLLSLLTAPLRAHAVEPPPPLPDTAAQPADALTKAVVAEWQRQFLATHGLSPAEFGRRIRISRVERTDGPVYVWVRIEYRLRIDWVDLPQVASIELGEHPLRRTPDAAALQRAVARSLRPSDRVALPGVVSRDDAQRALRQCNMRIDSTDGDIRFENVSGRLLLHGRAVLDGRNRCKRAAVDLGSGALVECQDTPCAISGAG